jgi:penicillin-binding protein 2
MGNPRRRLVLRLVVVTLMGALFLRLYQLQLLYHTEFGRQSEENSVRSVEKTPLRGYMFDRHGVLMVDVGPFYTVTVTPAEFNPANIRPLASILRLDPEVVRERIAKGQSYSRFAPARILRDVDFRTVSAVEERLYLLPGVGFQIESKRAYPTPARASHLLGYCREVTDAQLGKLSDFYRLGDLIGASGLEGGYEHVLRGEKGYRFLAVNARGQILGSFEGGRNDIEAREGFDLNLTLDAGLQAYAESLMEGHRGALVAIDPSDGGILAMVSKPDFDPSIFSGVTAPELWSELNADTTKPLFNRASMTRYPPGSTYKMVLAAAALEEGIISKNDRIMCYGAYRFGNRTFKDLHVHGSTNIVEAIQRSCNVFFYQLMLKVGFEKWVEYSKRFGFGQPTGIDIGEETQGLVPTPAYFDRVYGKGKWTQGYLISLAIGQGEVGVSPLQMACYTAALANGGTLHQPHAVASLRNKRLNRVEEVGHRSRKIGISAATMEIIREGMRRAVQEPGGTGGGARIAGMESAGKTGTAENPHGADHAWYVGFAPFENPRIAVAVIVENAGYGGTRAAPIAGRVLQRYLSISGPQAPVQASPSDSVRHIAHTFPE